MMSYLQQKIIERNPEAAKAKKGKANVVISFVVDKDGTIKDAAVKRPIESCATCNDEALNAVKGMPKSKWTAGTKLYQKVKVRLTILVPFNIN
jgi:TonB family protein